MAFSLSSTRARTVSSMLAVAVTLLLAGCAPSTDNEPVVGSTANPEAGGLHWFNTEIGAVECLRAPSASGYYTSSCNWEGLRARQTVKDRPTLAGHWVTTKLGDMYCITNYTRYGYHQYDCDWAHIAKRTVSH